MNAISVDLEDRHHICGVDVSGNKGKAGGLDESVEKTLALFRRHSVKATFFTVGAVAESSPGLIRKISAAGHELASHGFSHRRIFDMSPAEFEEDLLKSKTAIEKASGGRILGYRSPEWSLKKDNLWALELLKKHGFEYDASAVPLTHLGGRHFGLWPHKITTKYGDIIEFPLSTFRCFWERLPFSGGLPMRINPYFYIMDNTININRRGHPVIFYLHPWELDPEEEKLDLPFNRKFMRYCNIASTEKKFNLLLERFEFSTVEDVLGLKKGGVSGVARPSPKLGIYYDRPYLKSTLSAYLLVFSICATLAILGIIFKGYALFVVLIFFTIFYWPWGSLFKMLGFNEKKGPAI